MVSKVPLPGPPFSFPLLAEHSFTQESGGFWLEYVSHHKRRCDRYQQNALDDLDALLSWMAAVDDIIETGADKELAEEMCKHP